MALGSRLFYELGVINEACIGGPGIDAVRFLRPARPGDTIHAIATVAETRPSRSKPDRGYVRMAYASATSGRAGAELRDRPHPHAPLARVLT